MTIIRIGLDTSKHVFQIHGVDESEQPVLRRQIRRQSVARFFATLAPTRIGLEACGASHHWARLLRSLGHEMVLIPPQYVKAYVQRGKNDKIDAEAICEAMSRPRVQARSVPIKTVAQQAALTMLGVRDLLVKQRTMLVNALREEGVPALAREMIGELASQLPQLDAKLKAIEARLMAWHRHDQTSRLLATIPGIGPIGGVSLALKVPDPKVFRSSRHFAAWVGITPRENSTAGRQRLGKISRAGDEGLRQLLV